MRAHGNMLATLPGSIGQLGSLRSLLLKANSTESLPEENEGVRKFQPRA